MEILDGFSDPHNWNAKVTLIVTFDPETGEVVVDRGPLPRMFAFAILNALNSEFTFSDGEFIRVPDDSDDDDDEDEE